MRVLTQYSIVRLIWNSMKAQGVGRKALVERAGYKNINKGLKRLDALLYEGVLLEEFIMKAGLALGFSRDEIRESISDTYREKNREEGEWERSIFLPHIVVKTAESRPRCSIVIAALVGAGREKSIGVAPDVAILPDEEQFEVIGGIIREHYKENDGKSHFFGDITGYVWRRTYDDGFEFDCEGKMTGKSGYASIPRYWVQIGSKALTNTGSAGSCSLKVAPASDNRRLWE